MRITRITLKLFLVPLLGIWMVEVGFSVGRQNGSYDVCYNVTGGEICYFYVSDGKSNWNTARGKCQNKTSYLPIIRNREEQRAIEAYLRQLKPNALSIDAVWTSGKSKPYDDWTWNNGQRRSNAINISNDHYAEKTHMTIQWHTTVTGNILKPEHPLANAWYLCQYKDRQCNGQQHEFNATNGCLIPSEYGNISWYGARNECLSNGGDLAILTDQDLQNYKKNRFPNNNYWIGLIKVNWVWQTNSQASPEEEVKYTKWARQSMPPYNEELCISNAANDGQWRASRCSHEILSVICEKRATTTTDSALKKSTTTTTAGNSHTTTVTISATTNSHNDDSLTTDFSVPAAIGAGVVILCIIVILAVIWRKSKSSNNKTEPAEMDSKKTNDAKDKKTKENPSTTTTEERSIYADIPLAERNANDAPETGQKGTVYASLDFNQGVTYAEPSTLYTNTQNVSGPMYEEPLNATGNGTTSAGSLTDVKIGPMGDVYALPTTNVTPSSDKTTERPIYANT